MTAWAQLQSDFPQWAKRTDQITRLPGFVALCETRFNRRLRVRQQATAFSGTINASNQIALQSDFLAVRWLHPSGDDANTIKPQTLEFITARKRTSGTPTVYAVGQSTITFDGSGDVAGTYFAAVPSLVSNGSNWLSVMAYDAYLFGALAEAALDERDTQQASAFYGRADSVIAELIAADQRDTFSGPLVARKR